MYKAIYDRSPAIPSYGPTTPQALVLQSKLCIYDSDMNIVAERALALPAGITGVHAQVYADFFYIFYQYQQKNTIYCMAARFGLEGDIIGQPVVMDQTRVPDLGDRSEVYSIISSVDKQKILAFKIDNRSDESTFVTSLLFDRDLHLIHQSTNVLSMEGSDYLREFHVDNDGNFIFIGLQGRVPKGGEGQALLFMLPADRDSLNYTYIIPPAVVADDIRLFVDNIHKKYIVRSLYSRESGGNIAGLYTLIRDARGMKPDIVTLTPLADKARGLFKEGANLRNAFNDYYLQGMQLRRDGSFTIEAQQLKLYPIRDNYNRWNYRTYYIQRAMPYFDLYNASDYNHYFPWRESRNMRMISGQESLIASFDTTGTLQWINKLTIPQGNRLPSELGFRSFIAGGRVYFIYNADFGTHTYLTVQNVDSAGQLNTDERFHQDMPLRDQSSDYIYFPRRAEVVGAGEVIVPCLWRRYVCLAKMEF